MKRASEQHGKKVPHWGVKETIRPHGTVNSSKVSVKSQDHMDAFPGNAGVQHGKVKAHKI
jgi:hypothetical protein